MKELSKLKKIAKIEKAILKYLSTRESAMYANMRDDLGLTRDKLNNILKDLRTKGIINYTVPSFNIKKGGEYSMLPGVPEEWYNDTPDPDQSTTKIKPVITHKEQLDIWRTLGGY